MTKNNHTDNARDKHFSWIPGFIRHDFTRKLCALLFTGIVMYYVYPKSEEYTNDYPIHQIRVRLVPAVGYLLTFNTPDYVNAVFKGDKGKLNMLNARDLVFTVPVGEQEWRNQKVTLNRNFLEFKDFHQGNIQLIKIEPSVIELKMNKIVTRDFPVIAVYDESQLPPGYCVQSVSFPNGNGISVTGDDALLNKLTEIRTMPIDLKNQIADFTTKVKLDKKGLVCNDDIVVNVRISRFNSKTFMNLPIQVMLSPEQLGKFTVEPGRKEAEIQLSGPKDIIDELKQYEVHPYLDLTKLSADKEHLNVPLQLRCAVDKPNVKLLTADEIRVTLKKIEEDEKSLKKR